MPDDKSIYHVTAKVDQVVTSQVEFIVNASDKEEAEQTLRALLEDFPKKTTVEGVDRAVVTEVHHWIPRSIEFLKIKKVYQK